MRPHPLLPHDGVLLDDFWGIRWHCSADPAFHISPFEGFRAYEDRYDKVLERQNFFSDQDAQIVVNEGRKLGWRNYYRGWDCPGGWQPIIDSGSFLEVGGVLEVCHPLRQEALPVMGASMELIVLDAGFRLEICQRAYAKPGCLRSNT